MNTSIIVGALSMFLRGVQEQTRTYWGWYYWFSQNSVFPLFCPVWCFFFPHTQTANSLVCLPQCSWPSPTLVGSQIFLLSDFTLRMYCLTPTALSVKKQLICLLSSDFTDASGQDRRGNVSSSFIVPYTRSGFCLVVLLPFRGERHGEFTAT